MIQSRLEKYKNYHCNKKFLSWKQLFQFWNYKTDDVLKKNKFLDISKTSRNSNVPTKIIKENAELFTDFIHSALKEASQSGNFPSCLKWAGVTPIFKKGFRCQIEIYGTASILPNVSKLSEKPLLE